MELLAVRDGLVVKSMRYLGMNLKAKMGQSDVGQTCWLGY